MDSDMACIHSTAANHKILQLKSCFINKKLYIFVVSSNRLYLYTYKNIYY